MGQPLDAESPRADGTQQVNESLRVNARYVEEIVIGWDLCPWAARAWRDGQVSRRVMLDAAPEITPVLKFIDELVASPILAIGLAIFPRASISEVAFGSFAERVRRADRARRSPDPRAPYLLAAFHPDSGLGADLENAAQLVSYIRRTPDPTLQLVRASLIGELSRDGRDLSADIAADNLAKVGVRNSSTLGMLLDDIRRDRDAAYSRL
ncbi:MAG TPA: DUF1415 family protein [Polyangia bacterium]|nr:DUF1415 family protein [Polyangia bacterium]